jgi:hypothetical protein
MTELAWHLITKDQNYAFARPTLVAHKRRKLELAADALTARQRPHPRRGLREQLVKVVGDNRLGELRPVAGLKAATASGAWRRSSAP